MPLDVETTDQRRPHATTNHEAASWVAEDMKRAQKLLDRGEVSEAVRLLADAERGAVAQGYPELLPLIASIAHDASFRSEGRTRRQAERILARIEMHQTEVATAVPPFPVQRFRAGRFFGGLALIVFGVFLGLVLYVGASLAQDFSGEPASWTAEDTMTVAFFGGAAVFPGVWLVVSAFPAFLGWADARVARGIAATTRITNILGRLTNAIFGLLLLTAAALLAWVGVTVISYGYPLGLLAGVVILGLAIGLGAASVFLLRRAYRKLRG
jgi:hypothetical protein